MNDSTRTLGGRYVLGRPLGHGGMADVHLAEDLRLHRTVAVKILRTELARDANFQERFQREAQSAASLNHPSIVAVYDTGEEIARDFSGTELTIPYIVMEHVQGRTLREFIDPDHPMDVPRASQIMAALLSALEYSHQMGIVHRDIKPGNVMITDEGDVKVMDFGIARALSDATGMTQTQAVMGTAQYLSPEQARGQVVDARSDIYSAACVYYELLTGRPPFTGDSPVSIAYQHVRELPQAPSASNPRINQDLDAVILTGLAKDREERYPSATAFARDIAAVMSGRSPALAGTGSPAGAGDDAEATTVLGAVDEDRTQMLPPLAATTALGAAGAGAAAPATGRRRADAPATLGAATGATAAPAAAGPAATALAAEKASEDEKRPVWLYVLLALAAIAAIAVAAFFLWPRGDDGAVQVPNVVGQTEEQARAELTDAGLTPQFTPQASSDVAVGTVISTHPVSGTPVDPGATVQVAVSSGPDAIAVPNLTGMTQEQATAELERIGLTLSVGQTQDSPEARGKIIAQEPPAGGTAEEGEVITVTIASGTNTVPDVTGQDQAGAEAALKAAGFPATFTTEESADAEAGTVIRQDPTGGSLEVGRPVTVVLAAAESKVALPNVVGATQGEAEATLTSAGFGHQPVTEASDTVAAGRVIRTDPEGGSDVDAGITVTIVVSSGPATPAPTTPAPAPSTTAPATTPAPTTPAAPADDENGEG